MTDFIKSDTFLAPVCAVIAVSAFWWLIVKVNRHPVPLRAKIAALAFVTTFVILAFCQHSARENGMTKQTFACAINCMDGRTQEPVRTFMRERFGVDFVDKVTEPGPNKILAENSQPAVIEHIKERVGISVHHHGSKVVAIVGHSECAGNPAEKEEQIRHLLKAKKTVESFGFNAEIILLFVQGDWKTVEEVLAEAL